MQFRSYHKFSKFRHMTSGGYSPLQLAAFYGFPPTTTGAGKNVAVIELGGGYVQADLNTYFKSLGLPSVKPVVFHAVDGATNAPGDPNGADGEVMLDLCMIGGMAPGAQLHCYMAPNTDKGFIDAINQAITDKMDAISISWGGPEDQWAAATITAMEAAFLKASVAGITVTVAAGDNGSSDGEVGNHVDYPASSPNVTGCGGTSLPTLSAAAEVVWNDGTAGGATGGGISSHFALPSYQSSGSVPGGKMRGVPDIAAVADPNTGVSVIIDGAMYVLGGTSAVAPIIAALAVRLAEGLGKNPGFLNSWLYSLKGISRDIVSGSNGTYVAKTGFDLCTGIGVPIGTALLAALKAVINPPAPTPVPPAPVPPAPTPAPSTRTIVVTGASKVTIDGKTV